MNRWFWRRPFFRQWGVALLGFFVLVVYYVIVYRQASEAPHPNWPGWWGWWDQSHTLASAQAFARFDLSSSAHWYAPGYALLGAPFLALGFERHPFVPIDLLCLLGTYAAFQRMSWRYCVSPTVATVLFLIASLWDRQVFKEWVIPWSSIPVALLMWLLLAERRRPIVLGLLTGGIAWFRPVDVLPAAVALVATLLDEGVDARRAAQATLGVLLALLPLVALHAVIYGLQASPYLSQSADIGFSLYDLGWKAYVILVDPTAWFLGQGGGGGGMIRRLPWVAVALAGLLPTMFFSGSCRILAWALAAHLVIYLSYVDLLPPGLWGYNNIHYWTWAIPGYLLLAHLTIRNMLIDPWTARTWAGAGALGVFAILFCVRIDPRPVAADEPAKMLVLAGPRPSFTDAYFGDVAIVDGAGRQRNVTDLRALPDPAGTRIIALRRDFTGDFTVGAASPPPITRFGEAVDLGAPCWIVPSLCVRTSAAP